MSEYVVVFIFSLPDQLIAISESSLMLSFDGIYGGILKNRVANNVIS